MTTTTRNIIVTLIAISVAAVFFAIWRNPLDSIIAGSAIFVADALLRLTKSKKPGIVNKSNLTPPQR